MEQRRKEILNAARYLDRKDQERKQEELVVLFWTMVGTLLTGVFIMLMVIAK